MAEELIPVHFAIDGFMLLEGGVHSAEGLEDTWAEKSTETGGSRRNGFVIKTDCFVIKQPFLASTTRASENKHKPSRMIRLVYTAVFRIREKGATQKLRVLTMAQLHLS